MPAHPKETKTVLGTNIRTLRKYYKVPIEDLGAACGVKKDTVLRWERGEVIPPVGTIARLCNIFNIPQDVLVSKRIIIE